MAIPYGRRLILSPEILSPGTFVYHNRFVGNLGIIKPSITTMHLAFLILCCPIFVVTGVTIPPEPRTPGSAALPRRRSVNLVTRDVCCSIGCVPDCPDGYICDESASGDTGCCPTGDFLCVGGSWCCPQGTECNLGGCS